MNDSPSSCTISPAAFPKRGDPLQRIATARAVGTAPERRGARASNAATRARRTPMPLRIARVARTVLHIVEGLATTALVFPCVDQPRQAALIRGWSARLLRILAIDSRVYRQHASELPAKPLIVANHISWLDIFLLNSLEPARFVAKAELARWPVVGRLIAKVGTLFIERERRHDTHKVNQRVTDALESGHLVAVFPEGTTSDGTELLRFHASLLQPIVDAAGHVQPVAIRYRTPAGEQSVAPSYAGETTFLQSFWRVTGERRLVAELHLAAPVAARARHRRELSRAAEDAIRTALGLAAADSALGRRDGPRA